MARKIGKQSYYPDVHPVIIATGTVAGPLEGDGPLAQYFDHVCSERHLGKQSFEQAEKEMMLDACRTALHQAGTSADDVDLFVAGDLLNQTITSGFSALDLGIPYLGLYGACSSSCESLILGAMSLESGGVSLVLTATSSHNSTAERQYRYPTEYGYRPKPSSQWTVTGAGAALLAADGTGPEITAYTVGTVTDLGCKDPMMLGAAMAPAAADTIYRHLTDTGRTPNYYDVIATGDLGRFGRDLTAQILKEDNNLDLGDRYQDCGVLLYDLERQPVSSGGSGCASSALVAYGCFYRQLLDGTIKRVLLVATGALHSPTSYQQGENIPTIAHAVAIEMP